jgi:hypothetical protein
MPIAMPANQASRRAGKIGAPDTPSWSGVTNVIAKWRTSGVA